MVSVGFVSVSCAPSAGGNGGTPTASLGDVFEWDYASQYTPAIMNNYAADVNMVKILNESSGGQFDITLHAAGALMSGVGVFDGVAGGSVEMGSEWPGYQVGKDVAFDYLGTAPFLFSFADYYLWLWQAGGIELAQELYGGYGLQWWPNYTFQSEEGFRTRKPINSLADVNGMTLRTSSNCTKYILEKLGASVVNIAGEELYTAVERGLVDGMEWNTPDNSWSMGFQQITSYWQQPHLGGQTGTQCGLIFNMKSWNSLPDHLKSLVVTASQANMLWSFSNIMYASAEYVEKFKAAGTTITRLSDADIARCQELAMEYTLLKARENPRFAKIVWSQVQYLTYIKDYRASIAPYGFGTNNAALDDLYNELKTIVGG
jgi:TRAP-type mannitol/chloroaromatic compound transport system substrate-binding protein